MRMIIAEENPTQGKIRIGKHNIESNTSPGFDQLGYCPQVTNYPLFRKIKVISIWVFVFQQYTSRTNVQSQPIVILGTFSFGWLRSLKITV